MMTTVLVKGSQSSKAVQGSTQRRNVVVCAQGMNRRDSLALFAGSALLVSPVLPAIAAPKKGGDGDWSSPGLNAPIPEDAPKFVKLDSGIRYQELYAGSGREAGPSSLVLIDYVLRRSNGYFIYSTVEGVSFQPKDIPIGPIVVKLGDAKLVRGLSEALVGMRPGGKRRILVPPELGYTDMSLQPTVPGYAAKRQVEVHSTEPLLFEVVLLRVDGKGVGQE